MIKRIFFLVERVSEKILNLYLKTLNKIVSQKNRVWIQIVPYSNMDQQTKSALDKMFKKVFNRTFAEHEKEWAEPQWLAKGLIGNKIVSVRYFLETIVLFDGEKTKIGGTGGLLTLPAYRGLGFAPKLIEYVDDFMETELHLDCALFICSESLVQYFIKLDWYKVDCKLYYKPNGTRKCLNKYSVMLRSKTIKYNPSVIEVDGKLW